MTGEVQTEEQLEAQLNELAAKIASGEVAPESSAEVDDAAPVVAEEVDDAEAKAKADGHMSYDDWVAAGKDPRAWRPAEEYNRRGELLKTPKPDLIERFEQLTRAQEESARLMAEQIRISREAQDRARQEGYQQAIQEARDEQERAFNIGDREAMRQAMAREQEAASALQQATQPQADPELVKWNQEASWYRDGFDNVNGQQVPKNVAVETFLVYQKDYMMRNPGARLIDSVRHAESKVKAVMPDFFRPAAPRNNVRTPTVEAGQRSAPKASSGLDKYPVAEQQLIRVAAKTFGKSVPEYLKMIEG